MNHTLINALHWIITILNKHNVSYIISGGFSAHLYWSNRRVNDIDIDIAESDFEKILADVREYIIFGPAQWIDEKWDLQLITLNYFGQEIDIWGASQIKLFDDILEQWLPMPANLNSHQKMVVECLEVNVVNPYDLIRYKSLLNGEHQQIDIQAVREHIKWWVYKDS